MRLLELSLIAVYDVTSRPTFDELVRWFRELDTYCGEGVVKVLVGNKVDKVSVASPLMLHGDFFGQVQRVIHHTHVSSSFIWLSHSQATIGCYLHERHHTDLLRSSLARSRQRKARLSLSGWVPSS